MFKKMLMKAAMQKQLKGMPKEMQDQVLEMVEKNPDFFSDIGKQIEERVKRGEDRMAATQAVAMANQAKLREMFQGK